MLQIKRHFMIPTFCYLQQSITINDERPPSLSLSRASCFLAQVRTLICYGCNFCLLPRRRKIFLEVSQLSSALPSTAEIPRKEKVVLIFNRERNLSQILIAILKVVCTYVRLLVSLVSLSAVKVKLWRILSSFKVAELYFLPYPLHSHCH